MITQLSSDGSGLANKVRELVDEINRLAYDSHFKESRNGSPMEAPNTTGEIPGMIPDTDPKYAAFKPDSCPDCGRTYVVKEGDPSGKCLNCAETDMSQYVGLLCEFGPEDYCARLERVYANLDPPYEEEDGDRWRTCRPTPEAEVVARLRKNLDLHERDNAPTDADRMIADVVRWCLEPLEEKS